MSETYRQSRNIEASLIDYLTTEIAAAWSNVNVEKTFARIYELELPSVCIRCGTTSHEWAEIGDNATVRTVNVLIDIFATSDGNKLDLTDFIVSKLKLGCPYYIYEIENGAVKTKTQDGRIRITSIDVTQINFGTDKNKLNPRDRYRALITCGVSLGKIEE